MSKTKDATKTKNSKPGKGNLLNLIPYLKPFKKEISLVVLAILVTSLMILFLGKALKYLIDLGFSANHKNLTLILAIFILLIVILAIAGYYRSSLINNVGEKFIANLRKKIYSHIIKVSSEFFEISKTGDVVSRLTVDTTLLYNIVTNSISFAVRNILLFFGGIAFLFLTSVKLTLISLAVIPIAIAPIIIMGRKIKKLSNQSQQALAVVGAHIEETINGVKTIQSYLCEDKEIRNFNHYISESLNISLKKIKLRAFLIALVITFSFGSIAIVLWFGGSEILKGNMTSGDLSSFLFYSVICATSLTALSEIMGQFNTAAGAAERLFELLEIESPVTEIDHPEKLETKDKITICFKNVDFYYPSRFDSYILKNFNFEINDGDKIAIVGLSGSGKSTILQLLMRFYDVTAGEILINGQNIQKLSLEELRNLFSYISQDCFIFSGTIYENIAYVDKDITRSQVEDLVNQNAALNFINNLPEKLDCFVGEKGIKLSGGERQRIAIARAILKNSPIMLLDEATSALDNENENLIIKSLNKLMKNKTVITIAHKLSTIINSDKIIFIKDGQIIEYGTHEELISLNGFYKKMYEAEVYGLY